MQRASMQILIPRAQERENTSAVLRDAAGGSAPGDRVCLFMETLQPPRERPLKTFWCAVCALHIIKRYAARTQALRDFGLWGEKKRAFGCSDIIDAGGHGKSTQ
jgi:hypothetical protein